MSDRTKSLLHIRPEISSAKVTNEMSDEEQFQNRTLRPIIKFQNHIFVVVFKNYISKYKNSFYELTLEKRFEYIANAVQKDMKFRNTLKGIIIGHFTFEEYESYIKNSSALNKRMMRLVTNRLKDQIQLFEIEILM